MTRQEAREIYYKASSTLSQATRHLNLAGVAIIWIFKAGESNAAGIKFHAAFLWPLALFIVALGFDLLQYAYKSAAWAIFHTIKDRKKDDTSDAPDAINWPTLFFFWGKVILTVVAYCALSYGVSQQLVTP